MMCYYFVLSFIYQLLKSTRVWINWMSGIIGPEQYFQSTLPERKPVCSSYFNIHHNKSELCPKYLGWVESEMDGYRQFICSQIYTGAAGKTCCVCPTFITCCLTGLFSIQAAQGSRNTFAHINRVAVITQKQPGESLCHSVTTEM